MAPSPATSLNLAIARGYAEGAEIGLALLDALDDSPLDDRHARHAARAEFLEQLGDSASARAAWTRAAACPLGVEQIRYIQRRLEAL